MRLFVIAGIRSHFIKMASMMYAIESFNKRFPGNINPVYINSGQHYDFQLSGQYIDEFNLKFDVDFTNSYHDLSPIGLLGDMIRKIYHFLSDQPRENSAVAVFGDANTTLAGAIAASKAKFLLVHIESGARSGNIKQPEEQNRVCTDHLADFRFTATEKDMANLASEGLTRNSFWVGDIIYDLIVHINKVLDIPFHYAPNSYILATLHREENILSDQILNTILQFLNGYSKQVVFVTHPRTLSRIKMLKLDSLSNIVFVESLSYKQILGAIKGAYFVFTDSGGIQRETYYLGKRSLVRQDNPFWPTLISKGVHRQVYPNETSLIESCAWIERAISGQKIPLINDFGDGDAFEKIFRRLIKIH